LIDKGGDQPRHYPRNPQKSAFEIRIIADMTAKNGKQIQLRFPYPAAMLGFINLSEWCKRRAMKVRRFFPKSSLSLNHGKEDCMPAWSQPQDIRSWIARGLSFRGAALLLAVFAILISEMRFSWVEVLVGRYLTVTNAYRPESGNVWEQGRLKQVATRTLEQMVTRQLTAQREAREADSLNQLIEGLTASSGIMISAAQFRSLYSKIPESLARTLFSPIFMLRISAEKSWERVYLEQENGQVGIYLLDRGNNVLSYTTVTDRQLQSAGGEASFISGTLDGQPEFAGRIFPADRFFMALDTLSPEIQQGVLAHPGAVLGAEGTPVRVGFSDEVYADTIRIGIEMDTPTGRRILFTSGQEWAVWQVRSLLDPLVSKPASYQRGWPASRVDP
jgi:hypothetical protein